MHRSIWRIAPAALAAALATPSVAAAICKPTWSTVPKPPSSLTAIDARTDTDAWALGSKRVLHWDGSSWSLVLSDTVPMETVEAVDSNDVWLAGPAGRIMHWDGNTWSSVPNPMPPGMSVFNLLDADSTSPNDVWIVGIAWTGVGHLPLVEHWDGVRWSVVYSTPTGAPTDFAQLAAVDARAPNDVWAVGHYSPGNINRTLIVHWDGTTWTRLPSIDPDPMNNELEGVVAVAPNDVWAVGRTGTASFVGTHEYSLIEHWDGVQWSRVDSPSPASYMNELKAAAAVSPNDVWTVGYMTPDGPNGGVRPLSLHWDGTRWSEVSAGAVLGRLMLDMDARPSGRLFAVGGSAYQLCEIRVGATVTPPSAPGNLPGYGVAWGVDAGTGSHTVTDASGLGLFDSGLLGPGGSFTYNFGAGVYRIVDSATGHTSTVSVGVTATAVTPSEFAVAWAGAAPPAGYVYDVQVRRPGATAYADLAHGTTLTALTFTADAGPGPYGFRARLRNAATGKASGWSGTKTVTAA